MQHRQEVLVNQLWWTAQMVALLSMQVAPTRYYHIPDSPTSVPWLPVNHTLQMEVRSDSRISCAGLCLKNACTSFKYTNRVCSMDGVGDAQWTTGQNTSMHFVSLTNAANKRPTAGVKHYAGSGPSKAVDDNTTCNNNISCCYKTYSDNNRWMAVDLGSPKRVYAVDYMGFRNISRMMEVHVGSNLLATFPGGNLPWPGRITFSNFQGIVGRNVKITQKNGNFHVCDLQVLVTN